ncbi:hypothetical protein ACVWYQ_003371 [Bradyrhizobium sp. USDA 3397]
MSILSDGLEFSETRGFADEVGIAGYFDSERLWATVEQDCR